MAKDKQVPVLPMPDHLEPKKNSRSLATSVRIYFYALYNSTDSTFRKLLASVGNADSVTGNRMFDRHNAVGRIKKEAADQKDTLCTSASDYDVYKHLSHCMRDEKLGLRLRRQQYRQLTSQQQQPAE